MSFAYVYTRCKRYGSRALNGQDFFFLSDWVSIFPAGNEIENIRKEWNWPICRWRTSVISYAVRWKWEIRWDTKLNSCLKFRFPNPDRTLTYRFYDLSVSLPSTVRTETIGDCRFQAWPRVLRLLVWKSYGTRRQNGAGRWNLVDRIVESTPSRMARCFRDFPPIFSLPSFSLSCISSLAVSLLFDRIGWFFHDILYTLFKFVKL